jgi:hypothetical protein
LRVPALPAQSGAVELALAGVESPAVFPDIAIELRCLEDLAVAVERGDASGVVDLDVLHDRTTRRGRWSVLLQGCKGATARCHRPAPLSSNENNPIDALIEALHDGMEKIQASIRAKVEHLFRVIKRQFGYDKVRYRGPKKNTLQLKTLFALSNLWMVRHQLLAAQG